MHFDSFVIKDSEAANFAKLSGDHNIIHINKTVSDRVSGIVSSGRKTNVTYSQGSDSTLIIPFYIQR